MPEETALKDALRQAMRRLTSAVCVVTTEHDGGRYGMTATSVTSVSLDPPSLLLCVNRLARLHDPLVRRGSFCVNILHADDSEIAQSFGGACAGEERFARGAWTATNPACPFFRPRRPMCSASSTPSRATARIPS